MNKNKNFIHVISLVLSLYFYINVRERVRRFSKKILNVFNMAA